MEGEEVRPNFDITVTIPVVMTDRLAMGMHLNKL